MALSNNVNKSNNLLFRYLLTVAGNKWLKCFIIRSHVDKSIVVDTDSMDDFTTQLVQRKSNKWEILRARRMLNSETGHVKSKLHAKEIRLDIEYLDINKLDMLLKNAIEDDNISCVREIVNECVECKKLPTVTVLLQTLLYCSRNGDKSMIIDITELCRNIQPGIVKEYADFRHYLAHAIWIKGNISSAITIFEDVYRNNLYLRRIVRFMLKQLLLDSVVNRSEAALLNMIHFAERIIRDFKDYYPLACIWQACFLSEWFTDQTIAIQLLEENKGLLSVVSNQIPFAVTLSLKKHQTEVVYRLLEFLLRLEKKSECTSIVEALFDYRVSQGDLRGCSEIIKWSVKEGLEIQAFRRESFINLLLLYASDPTLVANISVNQKRPSKSGYQFKF